jgi:hypothetical protein
VSTRDVHPDEMEPLTEHEQEMLLAGRPPGERPELHELALLFSELREHAASAPAPRIDATLATLFRDGQVPAPAVSGSPRRRRVLVGAAATTVGIFSVGGLGAAGALPAPVQSNVARIADFVGVELPDGRREPLPVRLGPSETAPVETAPPVAPPAAAGHPLPARPEGRPPTSVVEEPDHLVDSDGQVHRSDDPGRSDEAPVGRPEPNPGAASQPRPSGKDGGHEQDQRRGYRAGEADEGPQQRGPSGKLVPEPDPMISQSVRPGTHDDGSAEASDDTASP